MYTHSLVQIREGCHACRLLPRPNEYGFMLFSSLPILDGECVASFSVFEFVAGCGTHSYTHCTVRPGSTVLTHPFELVLNPNEMTLVNKHTCLNGPQIHSIASKSSEKVGTTDRDCTSPANVEWRGWSDLMLECAWRDRA